jgi:hypothetical protein
VAEASSVAASTAAPSQTNPPLASTSLQQAGATNSIQPSPSTSAVGGAAASTTGTAALPSVLQTSQGIAASQTTSNNATQVAVQSSANPASSPAGQMTSIAASKAGMYVFNYETQV